MIFLALAAFPASLWVFASNGKVSPIKSVTTFLINVCIFKTNVFSERKEGINLFFILIVFISKLTSWNKDHYGGESILACIILTESTGIFHTFSFNSQIVHYSFLLFDKIVILPVLLTRKCVQVVITYQTIDSFGRGRRITKHELFWHNRIL